MRRRKFSLADNAREDDGYEPSPMETVANLSDVMLVLAVALMLALISRMGLDFTALQIDESSLVPVEDSSLDISEGAESGGTDGYTEVGRVYRNADGEMFILEG